MHPSTEEIPKEARRKIKKKLNKNAPNCILLEIFYRRNLDPSLKVQPSKIKWKKKISIWMPLKRLLPINLVDLDLTLF